MALHSDTQADKIAGGLLGMLIGDALSVPYEFTSADAIPPASQIEFAPPAGFRAAHQGVPAGTWSDDGAQALCLLASLLEHDSLNLKDFAAKLLSWRHHGEFTPDGRVFDCGLQTGRSLENLRCGAEPESSGLRGEYDNGNGSLMRVLPLALWHTGPDGDLVDLAHRQSAVTHAHARSLVCCGLYCLWARELLEGSSDGWHEAAQKLAGIYRRSPEFSTELEFVLDPIHAESARGSGYVLDTLWSVRRVLREGSFQAVVREAIRLGQDTDTTACVAGGLAGIRGGARVIPERWASQLKGVSVYEPLLEKLLQRAARGAAPV